MNVNYSVDFKNGRVHFIHHEPIVLSPQLGDVMWPEIEKACRQHECRKVLVEATIESRNLDTIAVFDAGITVSELSPRPIIAFCFRGREPDELTEFFETVAKNRGVNVEFFSDCDSAEKWLAVQ
jgi:hypothetical protein